MNGQDITKREIRGIRIGNAFAILIFLIGIEGSAIIGYSKIMNAIESGQKTDNVQQLQLDVLKTDLKALQNQIQKNSIDISQLKANINDMFFKTK